MLESLDAAYAFIKDTPRERSRVEAHWKLNRAYFDLIFAWGYAQSGHEARSRELLEAARAALPRYDVVHQTALKVFEARIRERGASPWTRLGIDLGRLEAMERYKVMRLFEMLAILSRVESVDGIAHFWRSHDADGFVPLPEDLVTEILVADGEGRSDDVRELLDRLFSSTESNGALLLGPSRRAGRDAELLAMLKRRPANEVSIALESLGAAEPTNARFNEFGEHAMKRIHNARGHIGALALRGRTADAEALIAEAWAVATDSFNTNGHFTLMPLVVCEILVMCTIRHELALGNRSRLDPLPQPIVTTAAPAVETNSGADSVAAIRDLTSWLKAASLMPGAFQERLRLQHANFEALLVRHGLPIEEASASPAMTLLDRVRRLEEHADSLGEVLELDESSAPAWRAEARTLLGELSGLVVAFKDRDPAARQAYGRIIKALGRVAGCLRSVAVERPTMTLDQLARLRTAQEAVSTYAGRQAEFDEDWRSWDEAAFEDLLASITTNLELANREVAALPVDWDPDVPPAVREAVAVVTDVLPELRAL